MYRGPSFECVGRRECGVVAGIRTLMSSDAGGGRSLAGKGRKVVVIVIEDQAVSMKELKYRLEGVLRRQMTSRSDAICQRSW